MVDEPVVVLTGFGVKLKDVRDPPLALSVTELLFPAMAATFTFNVELLVPRATLTDDPDMPIVKFGAGA